MTDTAIKGFPNLAGHDDPDSIIEAELTAAGVHTWRLPAGLRYRTGEVKTIVFGDYYGWKFSRAWRYWVVEGPGLPLEYAWPLFMSNGQDVRVDGHCGGVPPSYCQGFPVGLYHVDTPEGLGLLADTLKRCREGAVKHYGEYDG